MKYLFILLLLDTLASAEVIYFSDGYRQVDVSKKNSTLLLFPAPPLATSCQPAGVLSFETLSPDSMDAIERTHLQVQAGKGVNAGHKNERISRMLRASFLNKGHTSRCSISLANGQVVGADFRLKPLVIKPFIEFKPVSDRVQTDVRSDRAKEALRAVLRGKPLSSFEEIFRKKAGSRRSQRYLKKAYSTKKARYKLHYAGTDHKHVSIWQLHGETKVTLAYKSLALLRDKPQGLLFYSSLIPERSFKRGDGFKLYIVASPDAKFDEIVRLLP